MKIAYTQALHELGDGLFDLRLTREMLETMRSVTDTRPIDQAFNTHGDGDHCFGNQLLPADVPIYATEAAAAAEEMRTVSPALVHALFSQVDLGPEFDAFAARTMRRFDFEGIEQRLPTETFAGRSGLTVGEREVELIEVGPAHTAGDAILHVPGSGVVFTGDVLFIEGTPVMWAGPASNWLSASDRILDLVATVLVPGHGPVTDQSGVRDVQRYLTYVRDEARIRFDAGRDAEAAADDIDISAFADWGDPERIAVNVVTLYREFDPSLPEVPPPMLFVRMAEWAARH